MKTVVVTGVSSGIGQATAAVLIEQGFTVFGSVRREADAQKLQRNLGPNYVPLVFDVVDEQAIEAAAALVRERLDGQTLNGLVNNAGSSISDPLLMQSVSDFRRQIDINLVGVFAVTRAFAPLLGADAHHTGPKGRIVNLSSVGGKMGVPFLCAYVAAKHGVEGFSESLRRELQLVGIDVIIVGPGSVQTAIWDKAEALTFEHLTGTIWQKPYETFVKTIVEGGRKGYPARHVGEVIAKALTVSRPKTRYAVVQHNWINATLPGMLPKRLLDRVIGRRFRLVK